MTLINVQAMYKKNFYYQQNLVISLTDFNIFAALLEEFFVNGAVAQLVRAQDS